ncbi:hypothetical protein [Pseudomonas chlororaphis]|uniref:hypothetical protein n=1 Tax=Pseudomonas chlororaphis TaxID=587753 RepID=UPI0039E1150B
MHFEWALWDSIWKVVSSDGAPAWVQAIGSILALIIAIRVSRLSIEHAGLLKQKTIFSIAEAAHEYASKIRGAIDMISDEAGSNIHLYGVYHKDVTAGVVRALQGIPVHELASGQQVLAILGLTNQLVFLGEAAEKLLVDPSLLPHVSEALKSVGDDRNERRKVRATVIIVLKRNAVTHLDKIDEHYNALKRSLSH